MKLTVLGNNGPFPAAGGACSGYLLQEKNINILIDCGNGVLSNLQKVIGFEELDAIILTHLHSDHMSDMLVLKYAVEIKKKRGLLDKTFDVFAPPEPIEEYQRLDVANVFNLKSIQQDLTLRFGSITITFAEMKHPVKCFAVSAQNGNSRFVFSGDTSWTESIIEFSSGSDLLMLDAGLLAKDKTSENVPHLTARECGIVAQKSGVKKLLLTHFWPEYNVNELLSEAKESFENVETSKLLYTYEV